jgi:hypothetical protein
MFLKDQNPNIIILTNLSVYFLGIFKLFLVFDCRLEEEFHLESMHFKLHSLFLLLQRYFRILLMSFHLSSNKNLNINLPI